MYLPTHLFNFLRCFCSSSFSPEPLVLNLAHRNKFIRGRFLESSSASSGILAWCSIRCCSQCYCSCWCGISFISHQAEGIHFNCLKREIKRSTRSHHFVLLLLLLLKIYLHIHPGAASAFWPSTRHSQCRGRPISLKGHSL